MYAPTGFFVQNLILNNFYFEAFFDVINIFGSVLRESTFPFLYIIIFQTWQSSPLPPLHRGRYTCMLPAIYFFPGTFLRSISHRLRHLLFIFNENE